MDNAIFETEYKHNHAYNCTTEQIEQLQNIPAFKKTGFSIELIRPEIMTNGTDRNDGTVDDLFYYLNVNGVTISTGNIFDILNAVQIMKKLYAFVYPNE